MNELLGLYGYEQVGDGELLRIQPSPSASDTSDCVEGRSASKLASNESSSGEKSANLQKKI